MVKAGSVSMAGVMALSCIWADVPDSIGVIRHVRSLRDNCVEQMCKINGYAHED
jgi:hypothetical protein